MRAAVQRGEAQRLTMQLCDHKLPQREFNGETVLVRRIILLFEFGAHKVMVKECSQIMWPPIIKEKICGKLWHSLIQGHRTLHDA